MISFYTSYTNSFIMAALLLLHVAAIYNCNSEFVHWWEIFVLVLCVLEAHWRYRTIKNVT